MVLPLIGAIGGLATGAGSLIGAVRGGGSQQQLAPGSDYASLYATQLAPGNVGLTVAAQQLAALTGPYIQGLNANTSLQSSQALGQFNQAAYKDQTTTDLLAGLAGAYQSSILGNEDLAAKYKTATEFLGPSTAASMTNLFGQTAGALQQEVLKGESSALNSITQGQVAQGLNAANLRNQTVAQLASTNMDIRKEQERTKNALALQRGQVEGQLAMKRFGAGMALAGAQMFA
jgi:hypothetical protein